MIDILRLFLVMTWLDFYLQLPEHPSTDSNSLYGLTRGHAGNLTLLCMFVYQQGMQLRIKMHNPFTGSQTFHNCSLRFAFSMLLIVANRLSENANNYKLAYNFKYGFLIA